MPDQKPLHPDIPTDVAWVVGRRIYIRCAKESTLNTQLLEVRATWDWEVRARWVGTGKRDKVLPMVQAHMERLRAREEATQRVLAAGLWVDAPAHEAARFFVQAGKLGGVWDGRGHRFALPTEEARATLQQAVDEWKAEDQAARERREREAAERREQEKEEARQAAIVEARRARERIIARSGRTLTGTVEKVETVSTRYMNRGQAEAMAWPLGSVQRLRDGRRGLVVTRRVWFVNEDDATDLGWHPDAPDQAHWLFTYELEVVEATEAEQRADAAAAAERADAVALHDLVDALRRRGRPVDAYTRVPEGERVGTISGLGGTCGTSQFDIGAVILTEDGRVVWQHPGHYDDYQRAEAVLTDPELVARVRGLLDAGSRTRHVEDQMTYTYEVRVGAAVDNARVVG